MASCFGGSPSEVPPEGLTVLRVPDTEPSVDIVFVHGFTGHPYLTWRKCGVQGSHVDAEDGAEPPRKLPRLLQRSTARENSSVYWPTDLLPSTIPDARIMTYGYDTHIRHRVFGPRASKNTVYDIARDFLVALEAERRDAKDRSLIFVAHSLGGIVVKEMLRQSQGCHSHDHLRQTTSATIGIVFFGTPHSGADPRGPLLHVAERIVRAFGVTVNQAVADTLLPSAERLRELRDEFPVMAQRKRWSIHSFQEQLGVRSLGGHKVVEDTSSCLHLPLIEVTQHIANNHMEMCRFSGLLDLEYRKVAAALERFVKCARGAEKTRGGAPDPAPPVTDAPGGRDALSFNKRVSELIGQHVGHKPYLEAVEACHNFTILLQDEDDAGSGAAMKLCGEILQRIRGSPLPGSVNAGTSSKAKYETLGQGWPMFTSHNMYDQPAPPATQATGTGQSRRVVRFRPEDLLIQSPQVRSQSLFDGEAYRSSENDKSRSKDFFEKMTDFLQQCETYKERYKSTSGLGLPESKIRVAVLDTGINREHASIRRGFQQGINRMNPDWCHSWIGNPADIHDTSNHGTNVTHVLRRIAPFAEVCVAKIFKDDAFDIEQARNISKAIDHAVCAWKVDIICMSFCVDKDDITLRDVRDDIENAIERHSSRCLFFAAAGNKGRNQGRCFPATFKDVFCVHACDGNGEEKGISPLPVEGADNFSTLGVGVYFREPVMTGTDQSKKPPERRSRWEDVHRSGTSYATPVLAGIAANVLRVAELIGCEGRTATRLRKHSIMEKMLREMSDGSPGSYRFTAPWLEIWRPGWEASPDDVNNIRQRIDKVAR